MNINIKATGITLTPDVRDYLDKKLYSIGKFINPDSDTVKAQVELGRTTRHHQTGDIFRAEINLIADGKSYRAVSEESDLLSAIDFMKDTVLTELRADKSKKIHFLRKSGQRVKEFLHGFYKRNRRG